jgi:acetylornithine/succinyldiaminopimelate/putrescine aminotransferase
VVRVLAPLIAEPRHVSEAVEAIEKACAELRAGAPARKAG